MANEIVMPLSQAGLTDLYAVIFQNSDGNIEVYNKVTKEFEDWDSENISDYTLDFMEVGNGFYCTALPIPFAAGNYHIICYQGNKTINDIIVGGNDFIWDNLKEITFNNVILSADGLSNISMLEPVGVASDFREMIVQIWRRFFKKISKKDSIKTYKDNGQIATTQEITIIDDMITVKDAV
jgi:hypothetical protein